jgi:putative holliday junction resolvase
MRYLGIDYGAKRIGLAVSDEAGTIAFPRETIANMSGAIAAIRAIIQKEHIGFVVVGDTKSHGGLANPVTSQAQRFVDTLKEELNIPVSYGWEAGSSIEASRYAPESEGHNDSAAAAIILQRFLDMRAST